MRARHLGLSCTQPAPLPVCTETTLPNCKWGPNFNFLRSRTSSVRYEFRLLLHSSRTPTSLHSGHANKLYGGYHPDEEPCRTFCERVRRRNLQRTGRGTLRNYRVYLHEDGSHKVVEIRSFLIIWAIPPWLLLTHSGLRIASTFVILRKKNS